MIRSKPIPAILVFALVLFSALSQGSADDRTFDNQLRSGIEWLQKAQGAYVAGDDKRRRIYAKQAGDIFLQLARSNPRDLRPIMFGGQAAAFAGDVNGAWRWTEEYKARTPYGENDPDLHYLRAFVLVFAAEKPERAIRSLNRMYAINPNARPIERDTLFYVARVLFGEELMWARRYDNAIKQFQEAARLARRRRWPAKELAALGNAGMTMRVGTIWKGAEEIFRGLIARDPGSVLWHWHLALTLAAQLKFEAAIGEYKQVIEMRAAGKVAPKHAADIDMVFLRIGNCYRNLAGSMPDDADRAELFKKAEVDIRKYVELHPDAPLGHKWLGHLRYPDQEDPYGAIPHFEKAFALDPDCDSSLRSLTQIYSRYPAPPVEGESEADHAARQAAWIKQRDAYKQDLEEGAARRKKALEEREKKSQEDNDGCE